MCHELCYLSPSNYTRNYLQYNIICVSSDVYTPQVTTLTNKEDTYGGFYSCFP